MVARFNKNGTLDSGFSNNGKKKIAVGFHSYATGIAVNSKGEIIVAGYNITEAGFSQPVLIGLNSSGELNDNFGNKGIAAIKLNDNASIAAMALTGNEKIIAAGGVGSEGNSNFFLIRFNQHGKVDSSFGVNGIVNSDLGFSDQITSIAIQPDEKIIAAGNSFDEPNNETYFALSRYYSNGKPDNNFGSQGRILTAFSGHTNLLSKILLQEDNKIVSGGTSRIRRYGYGDFALSRYLNDDNNKSQASSVLNPDNKKPLKTVTAVQ